MTSLTEQQNSGVVFVESAFVRGKASCPCQRVFVVSRYGLVRHGLLSNH